MSQNGTDRTIDPADDPLGALRTVLPGDALELPGGEQRTIGTILVGNERIEATLTEWRWLFLDDGSLLEVAPKGWFRYPEHCVLERGTSAYEDIVARDGALVRFERRVRDGTVHLRTVRLTLDHRAYRVTSTGTATVQRFGPEPALGPWRAFVEQADQNVYFGLRAVADDARFALGVWTDDVCVSFGGAIAREEIRVARSDSP